MIWESSYWKGGLLRQAQDLHRRAEQRRWPEASLARLEQSLTIGFYSIRKLIEARKLSDSTIGNKVVLRTYASNGKPVTLMNWHRLDELFNFDDSQDRELDLLALCNQFIHSYVFSPVFSEQGRLQSVLLSSDRAKSTVLYEVALTQIITVFELVANDYPKQISMVYDPAKRDYKVTAHMICPESPWSK